jgi:ElaB/YqjD/DUF883 family membrane-anchored ribosome-binding protein
MFESGGLRDELQSLKVEMAALLNTKAGGFFDASGSRADALADQVKVALKDLGETLNGDEEQLEKLIADRPIAMLASAFAVGVVVGYVLMRH